MAQERFYYNSPSSPLQTVDESIVSSILFMYKEGTPISLIKKQFPDIKIFHNLYLHLPYEITEDICPCGNPIYKKVKGRTSYNDELFYCTVCKHDTTLECTCENCETKRNNEFEARKSRFMDHWQTYYKNTYNSSIELNNLSMYEEIQLVIFINEYYNHITKSFNFRDNKKTTIIFDEFLFPSEIFEFIQIFIQKKTLIPEQNIQYFDSKNHFRDNGLFEPSIRLSNCQWKLNISKDGEQISVDELFDYLIHKEYTPIQREVLWKECYQESIKNYFKHLTKDFIKIELLESNLDLISQELFSYYSLSKAYRLIYYSINSLVKYQAKYKTTTLKSSNTYLRNQIINNIEKYLNPELYKTLKDFNPITLPESVFTSYVKKFVLKNNRDYFYFNIEELKAKF